MLNKLTYKRKFRLCIALGLVMTFVMLKFPVGRTVSFYQDVKSLEKQLSQATDAPMRVITLQKQLARIDQALGKQSGTKGISKDEALLETITRYCHDHNALLREFPRAGAYKENEMQVETSTFVVEGDFATLLALVYQLEQKNKVGRVASVNFQSKRDLKTTLLALSATIYVQSIKKSEL
jgi:hypothetical protein